MIRPAAVDDQPIIETIIRQAYGVYVERIGKPPGPMLDDYGKLIRSGAVHVWIGSDDEVAGLIVLQGKSDHLLLDNVAVNPPHQGKGIGRELIAFAECEAL